MENLLIASHTQHPKPDPLIHGGYLSRPLVSTKTIPAIHQTHNAARRRARRTQRLDNPLEKTRMLAYPPFSNLVLFTRPQRRLGEAWDEKISGSFSNLSDFRFMRTGFVSADATSATLILAQASR
jgi:hypothetical protein